MSASSDGVGEHGGEIVDFASASRDRRESCDDVVERRAFARERDEGLPVGADGELVADFVVAAQNEVELVLSEHGDGFSSNGEGDGVNERSARYKGTPRAIA